MHMKKVSVAALLLTALFAGVVMAQRRVGGVRMKSETFDRDPQWDGHNNRPSDRNDQPVQVRQDFGFSGTSHAGGDRGEIGGFIQAAGEPAFYGKVIEPKTLKDPIRASGTFTIADGDTQLLLGFFNAETTNEWRTPNTVSIRINGRGDHFYAYVEYCTSKWRAGGDTQPFAFMKKSGDGKDPTGLPSGGNKYQWSLTYNPKANNGNGSVTAIIGDYTAVGDLDPRHKRDGAIFNRFGLMNVMKSAGDGTEIYLDNLTINGEKETFDRDPKWDQKNNRRTYQTNNVRPRFDFGYSPTNFAGGKGKGELGGQIFRGDIRYPDSMAYYADEIGPLTLDKPFAASGKVVMLRGVTDSTTMFGFFNAEQSMRTNPSQNDAVPESMMGINIEGPSSEGFLFYPVYRTKGGAGRPAPRSPEIPYIFPDAEVREWKFLYNPAAAGGKGRISISLDGRVTSLDLMEGEKSSGTRFDRFGIITPWIDGAGQTVYFDDLTYTVSQ